MDNKEHHPEPAPEAPASEPGSALKKYSHLSLFLGAVAIFLAAAVIFVLAMVSYGYGYTRYSNETTIFKVLAQIDYVSLAIVFASTIFYAGILDAILVLSIVHWKKYRRTYVKPQTKKVAFFWYEFRKIHVVFMLLTIFTAVGFVAPRYVINMFTAVVSISLLVSNLTRPKERKVAEKPREEGPETQS